MSTIMYVCQYLIDMSFIAAETDSILFSFKFEILTHVSISPVYCLNLTSYTGFIIITIIIIIIIIPHNMEDG